MLYSAFLFVFLTFYNKLIIYPLIAENADIIIICDCLYKCKTVEYDIFADNMNSILRILYAAGFLQIWFYSVGPWTFNSLPVCHVFCTFLD